MLGKNNKILGINTSMLGTNSWVKSIQDVVSPILTQCGRKTTQHFLVCSEPVSLCHSYILMFLNDVCLENREK